MICDSKNKHESFFEYCIVHVDEIAMVIPKLIEIERDCKLLEEYVYAFDKELYSHPYMALSLR